MNKKHQIFSQVKWGIIVAFCILFTAIAISFTVNVVSTNIRPAKSPSYDKQFGAKAKCEDGMYSYSHSRAGTCSGHGGVKEWL